MRTLREPEEGVNPQPALTHVGGGRSNYERSFIPHEKHSCTFNDSRAVPAVRHVRVRRSVPAPTRPLPRSNAVAPFFSAVRVLGIRVLGASVLG